MYLSVTSVSPKLMVEATMESDVIGDLQEP
jgi:hypothetical protein